MPSAHGIAEAFDQDRGTVFFTLLTIIHQDLTGPMRLCNSRADIVSRGNTFTGYPFQIVLPDDDADNVPSAQLKIDNVNRLVYQTIWGLASAPNILIEVVVSDRPDVVEISAGNLRLEKVQADELYITGTITAIPIAIEPFPGDSFSPDVFVSMF